MMLSEMFGVKRGEPFMVEECADRFMVVVDDFYTEFLRIQGHGKGEWIDASSYAVYEVIKSAPSGIIHLPPPLTDEQRVLLMSLFTMGARYMGMTQEGWKRCFVNKPQKEFSGWTCGDTQALTIAHGMANCLDSLVSWSDPEPYDIGKALGV